MIRTLLLAGAALATLAACSNPPRYTLDPPVPAARMAARAQTIVVRDVSLPEYAAAPEMALQGADGQVTNAGSALWADDPVRGWTNALSRQLDAMLVAVGNGPSFGGGLRITEGALLDDGMLDVVVIKPMSKPGLVRTYPKLFKGTHVTHPQYEHHRVRSVTVAAPGIVAYADGERFGPLPLTVQSDPGALSILA